MASWTEEEYQRALRQEGADRWALWHILQHVVAQQARNSDDPAATLSAMNEDVIERLDRKDGDAAMKGLSLTLEAVKGSANRFFSDLAARNASQDL